jgi:uncharacterized protein (UPF0297 family)
MRMAIPVTADDKKQLIDETLKIVYDSLNEKGYNPISQILGYIFTDDPTYITPHNNARELIAELDREDIGYRLLEVYFQT